MKGSKPRGARARRAKKAPYATAYPAAPETPPSRVPQTTPTTAPSQISNARALAPAEEIPEDQTRTRSQPDAMVAGIAGRPVTQTQQEAEGKATERNGTEPTPTTRHTNRPTHQPTDRPTRQTGRGEGDRNTTRKERKEKREKRRRRATRGRKQRSEVQSRRTELKQIESVAGAT